MLKFIKIAWRRLLLGLFFVVLSASLVVSRFDKSGNEGVSHMALANGQGSGDKAAVPIIMYHSVCDNKKVLSDYRISPSLFEEDLKYLRSHGYESVFVSDLVAFVKEGKPLSDKPVILTFDDGYLNNLTEVLPLLEKYSMCATISVVGEFCSAAVEEADPNPMYAYLTWADIQTLSETGIIEIGNHTNAMHEIGERKGCMKISGESDDGYEEALCSDLSALQEALAKNSNVTPTVFTYPFGFVSDESLPIIKKLGFSAALTCYEKINYIDGSEDGVYKLGRFNRSAGLSTEQFMKKCGI